ATGSPRIAYGSNGRAVSRQRRRGSIMVALAAAGVTTPQGAAAAPRARAVALAEGAAGRGGDGARFGGAEEGPRGALVRRAEPRGAAPPRGTDSRGLREPGPAVHRGDQGAARAPAVAVGGLRAGRGAAARCHRAR